MGTILGVAQTETAQPTETEIGSGSVKGGASKSQKGLRTIIGTVRLQVAVPLVVVALIVTLQLPALLPVILVASGEEPLGGTAEAKPGGVTVIVAGEGLTVKFKVRDSLAYISNEAGVGVMEQVGAGTVRGTLS